MLIIKKIWVSQTLKVLVLSMFVRKKSNKSGLISIQVIDKSSGKYKVVKTMGCSDDPELIERLVRDGKQWILSRLKLQEFDFSNHSELYNSLLSSITAHRLVGIDLVLGKIFNELGFNKIEDELFRSLVLYRLVYPKSKLKTTQYIYRYEQKVVNEDAIYRYMDKLHSTQKELVQQISYDHTLKILGNDISIVFYDVTTLYFEVDHEDELRKSGFSKDGKHQHPQIILGLLVSKGGYPLGYEIYEGNKYEGHTILPVLDGFKKKYNLSQLVIIADSGLLSNANITELQQKEYEFILGARIKSESGQVKEEILALELQDGQSTIINKGELRLIISYSLSRASKDKYNRERGLSRLNKLISRGKLNKSNINNRGYNKFLKMEGDIEVTLDQQKVEQDSKWDGLKGYVTNAKLSKEEIMDNYKQLWQIEKAFRISKTDLKIRPIFHRLQRRIEAHICLSFVAYKLYKELERQLKKKKSALSPQTIIEIASNIYELEIEIPNTKERIKKVILHLEEQRHVAKLFNF